MVPVLLTLAALRVAVAAPPPPRPNIVLLVIDDMGWHNIHAPPLHVNAEIISPALARFATEGLVLSQYYAYRYCGPSRASLLTGRLPGHGIAESMFSHATPNGYNANLTMLPAKLKAQGYATHAIGKWHCGFWQRRFLPTSRGFDTFAGYLGGSEDHYSQRAGDSCGGSSSSTTSSTSSDSEPSPPPPSPHLSAVDLWQDRGDGTQPPGGSAAHGLNGSYSAFTYTELAVATIDKHAAAQQRRAAGAAPPQPLFLYLALQNIHGPDQVEERFLAPYNASMYAARRTLNAMVSAADESVANVTAALQRNGMEDDTLVVVVSDNGGPIQEPGGNPSPGNNYPLRGGKYSFYEGGINVVGMLKWPAVLGGRAGAVYDGLLHAVDLYATLATLGGASADDTGVGRVPVDGIDVWQALLTGAPSPRQELLLGMGFENTGSLRRADGMKLLVGHQRPAAWVGPRYPNASTPSTVWPPAKVCTPGCLYNLTADPREDTDLAAAQPELLQAMLARYGVLVANLSAPNGEDARTQDPAACAAAEAAGGWWSPWGGE